MMEYKLPIPASSGNFTDKFIEKFSGYTEPYFFYNGTVELRYDPKNHVYYLISNGQFIPQAGVTTTCHILDKSPALMPWACKMMAEKLFKTVPLILGDEGLFLQTSFVPQMVWADFEKLVLASKNAHKEKVEEAATVGSIAHNWIEQYIKAVLAEDRNRIEEILAKFPTDERAKNSCIAALDWMHQHNVRWVCTERKIYSKKYQYAGTMDGLAKVDSCSDPLCCPHAFKDRLSIVDWKTSNYLYIEYLYQTAAYEQAYEEEMGVVIQDRWINRLGKDDAEFDPWHMEEPQFRADFEGFLLCLDLSRNVESLEARMKAKKDGIKAERKRVKEEAKAAKKAADKELKATAKAMKKAEKEMAKLAAKTARISAKLAAKAAKLAAKPLKKSKGLTICQNTVDLIEKM